MYQGVCGHSSVEGQSEYVIFCVGQSYVRIAQFMSWAYNGSLKFKRLLGMYKGTAEQSFIMSRADFEEHVQDSKWLNGEESILVLGAADARDHRPAALVYKDGHTVQLGRFKSVTRATALRSDCWTYDPLTREYFVAETFK